MFKRPSDDLSNAFVTLVCGILADTAKGFSKAEILDLMSNYAVQYNVEIPHAKHGDNDATLNKRTILANNIHSFSSLQKFKIISDLISHPPKSVSIDDIEKLKNTLYSNYGHLVPDDTYIDLPLVKEASHWLEDFTDAHRLYIEAIKKYKIGGLERNVLDDLRLSLEILLKNIFENQKSLESQLSSIGDFINKARGSSEFTNMFQKLLEYFTKYQNSHIKHNDDVIEIEIEFLIDLTSMFMKHIIKIYRIEKGK